MTLDQGVDLSRWIDLEAIPYTVRLSRLIVLEGEDGLSVHKVAWERPLDECTVVKGLRLLDEASQTVGIARVTPQQIEFDNQAILLVTPSDGVHIGALAPRSVVLADLGGLRAVCPDACGLVLPPDAEVRQRGGITRIDLPSGGEIAIACGSGPEPSFESAAAQVGADLSDWFARCPQVAQRYRDVTRLCWWVLGINTLRLVHAEQTSLGVVPSKLGYVGVWQWDAYFIAIGLRHGDVDLAVEQLRIALAHAGADGQLPDVVHDGGVLASSDHLVPADLQRLRELGSPSLAKAPVPLTKPPLTAVALAEVARSGGPGVIDEFLDAALAAQRWWYRDSAPAGRPAYLHPYSSGLDDSPVFDHDAIVISPDLTAYLITSDQLLATWLDERGRPQEAAECRARAEETLIWLASTWDKTLGFFPSIGEDQTAIASETIMSLMPLLVGGLPPELVQQMVSAIADPARFATAFALPTVAVRDKDHCPTRMWRGPVWINTNWLVARGLRMQGFTAEADELELCTLAMVGEHGPHEYYRPDTGAKAERAVTCFGWTAALTIDMAVRLS